MRLFWVSGDILTVYGTLSGRATARLPATEEGRARGAAEGAVRLRLRDPHPAHQHAGQTSSLRPRTQPGWSRNPIPTWPAWVEQGPIEPMGDSREEGSGIAVRASRAAYRDAACEERRRLPNGARMEALARDVGARHCCEPAEHPLRGSEPRLGRREVVPALRREFQPRCEDGGVTARSVALSGLRCSARQGPQERPQAERPPHRLVEVELCANQSSEPLRAMPPEAPLGRQEERHSGRLIPAYGVPVAPFCPLAERR